MQSLKPACRPASQRLASTLARGEPTSQRGERSKNAELQGCLLQTIAYSDIFDYPLTLEEIVKFLIGGSEVEVEVVRNSLTGIIADPSPPAGGSGQVSKLICTDGGFYFLKGRERIVETRKRREKWSKEKLLIAQETANKLKIIPSIKMVGVTGALAMENCKENDDIDLLIITSVNCLWLTRLLIILLSPFLGIKRRKPKEKNVKDKICFNLFLDENHLKIDPENLFLAHEICQVKPLLNKNKIYEKFLWENQWVRKYLPNAVSINNVTIEQYNNRHFIDSLLYCFIAIFDQILFYLQYLYMKPKITAEKVSLHQAFFHPVDLSDKVQKEFKRRIKSLVF